MEGASISESPMSSRRLTPEALKMPTSRPKLRLVRPRGALGPLPVPTLPPMRSGMVPRAIEPEWYEAPDSSQEDLATLRRPGTRSILFPHANAEPMIEFESDEYVSGTSTSVWNERSDSSTEDIFDLEELGVEEAPTSRGYLQSAFRQADSFADVGDEPSAENEFWHSRSGEVAKAVESDFQVEVTKHASVEAMRRARDINAMRVPSPSSLPSPFPLVAAPTEPFALIPPAPSRSKRKRRESTGLLVLRGLIWFVIGTSAGLFGAAYIQKAMAPKAPRVEAPRIEAPKPRAVVAAPAAVAPRNPQVAAQAAVVAPTAHGESSSKANLKASDIAKAVAALNAIDVGHLAKAQKTQKARPAPPPPVAKQTPSRPERLTPPTTQPTGAEAIPDLDALLSSTLAATH